MLREMEIQHFSHKEHPLMLVEELEKDGENEVVCSGCDKSVLCGPAYICSECKFFLHKTCAELPLEIQHPVLHPNHTFVLQAPPPRKYCDACRKVCDRCFFYHCNSCNFDLDIECAFGWQTKPDDDHQHEFVPIMQQIHFTCAVCGEDHNNRAAQVCRICQLLSHTHCTMKPRTMKIMAHHHLLTLIYSLGQVIIEDQDVVFCKLCYKKLDLKYAGYYCQECNFAAHLKCARKNSIGPSDTIDSSIDFIEDIYLEESEVLKHFDHKHSLILSRKELEVDKICEGCVQAISAPFYSCEQCNYFLHSKCARLPLKKQYPSHPHQLTLCAIGQYIGGLQFCYACQRWSHGFAYICQDCKYSLDIRCCFIPKPFKHRLHEHSLFHAISSIEKCNACDRSKSYSGVFVCTECSFALGFECATLPLEADYEYDSHPLALAYIPKTDSEDEYYCIICEEERNPNHWFYYCVECDFTAYPQCVIGFDHHVNYGRTFKAPSHPHTLNFVQRSENSPPCEACGESFKLEMALNCAECKSITHCKIECRDIISKSLKGKQFRIRKGISSHQKKRRAPSSASNSQSPHTATPC